MIESHLGPYHRQCKTCTPSICAFIAHMKMISVQLLHLLNNFVFVERQLFAVLCNEPVRMTEMVTT